MGHARPTDRSTSSRIEPGGAEAAEGGAEAVNGLAEGGAKAADGLANGGAKVADGDDRALVGIAEGDHRAAETIANDVTLWQTNLPKVAAGAYRLSSC